MNNNLNQDDCRCLHPTVCIFMSKYNATKYVKAQVDSSLTQSNVEIKLWIRDNGSTDNTVALLNNENGKDHRVTNSYGKQGLNFRNALIQTVASSAATAMNRAAFYKLRSACPKFVVMHDAWGHLVITAVGSFLYSDSPTLLYRQHATNVFGIGHSWCRRMVQRIGRLRRPVDAYRRQADEFYRLYGHRLGAQKSRDIEGYLNYRTTFLRRVQFAIRPSIIKQRNMANIYMRLLILLGKE